MARLETPKEMNERFKSKDGLCYATHATATVRKYFKMILEHFGDDVFKRDVYQVQSVLFEFYWSDGFVYITSKGYKSKYKLIND